MVVSCPACYTRFVLDENLIHKESVRVRCSKCRHTFTVRRPGPLPAEAAPAAAPDQVLPEVLEMPPAGLSHAQPLPASPPAPGPPESARPRSRRPWVWVLAGLLAASGLAAGWLAAFRWPPPAPPATAPPQAALPPAQLPAPPPMPEELKDLRLELGEARHDRLENARGGRLLVLTGEVLNQGPRPRGPIRLRAALVDGRHREVAHRLAYAGSSFTDEELTTLAPEELERWLNTPGGKSGLTTLPPQERLPYTVVFFGVPADLAAAGYGFTLAVVEAPPATQP